MEIQPTQTYSYSPKFQSVYPVYHWVAETNGSYAPVLSNELSKTLNGKLVRVLNTNARSILNKITKIKHQELIFSNELEPINDKKIRQYLLKQMEKLEKEQTSLTLMQRIQNFIKKSDIDYIACPYVRTFYNRNGGIKDGKIEPLVYLLTGKDALHFEEEFGRPLGQLKSQYGTENSAELQQAKVDYWFKGLNFVKSRAKKYCKDDRIPRELHIKTETERTKTGRIKGYNTVDMAFFPVKGPKNPFELTEWAKR